MRQIVLALLLSWTTHAATQPPVSISPTGRFVAVAEVSGNVHVVDATSGVKLQLGKGQLPVAFAWAAKDQALFLTRNGVITGYSLENARFGKRVSLDVLGSDVEVSPDGRRFAFIRANNLWISPIDGRKPISLSQNGNANLLVGLPDPIYASEFHVKRHYWWSPDSTSIAYIETEFQQPDHYVLAGAKLPVFRLKLADAATGQSRVLAESSDDWPYLLRPAWHPDAQQVFLYRLNRLQTTAELCAVGQAALKTVLTEKDAYWINAPTTPIFVNNGTRFVVTSERTGARHAYLYDLDGKLVSDLSPKDLEIYQTYSTSDPDHVYVTASVAPHQDQHLYRLNLDGSAPQQVTQSPGWHEVLLNAPGDSYLDEYSSSTTPPSIAWHGKKDATREIIPPITQEKPVANEFLTIKTHDDIALPARLFKPDDFDAQKKYPVILYTFSGPRGRVVEDSWDGWQMEWNRSMVRKGYLVLAVDVRGSAGYGHLFEEYIHYRFGAQETADLREVASYLRRQTYVDGTRLGIWGCDYGAHTVVHAMWQFPGGFKAGFADSPIADWTKYDAYFAERYLGLPAKRINEYDDSTALHDARRMTGTLMVAAGEANLLIRHEHAEALQKAITNVKKNPEVAKRFFLAPRPGDEKQLMQQMTDFFKQNL